jgi:hypothetical protein
VAGQASPGVLRCRLFVQEAMAGQADLLATLPEQSVRLELELLDVLDGAAMQPLLDAIAAQYRARLELKSGIRLVASGPAAAAAVAAPATLPNALWRALLTEVDAFKLTDQALLALREHGATGALDHVHYRFWQNRDGAPVSGGAPSVDKGSADVVTALLEACDQYAVSCSLVRVPAAFLAAQSSAAAAGPPPLFAPGSVMPVFTRIQVNTGAGLVPVLAGLQWKPEAVVNTNRQLVLPLRYRGNTPPLREARSVQFDITLRRAALAAKYPAGKLRWELSDGQERALQSGEVTPAADGTLNIRGLMLTPQKPYRRLTLLPPPPQWQVVYTRQPRARKPVPGTPIAEAANWQHATDVGRINGGIAEADVVIDDLQGNTKVIHDCTTSRAICVAHEARVSPDGTKIAYSVGYGNELVPVRVEGVDLGIRHIPGLTHADIWIYDLQTGKKWPVPNHPDRAIDRQPEWLNNEKIVFASNRAGVYPFKNPTSMHQGKDQFGRGRCFNPPYCVSQEYGYAPGGMSMQIWTMNIDGTDARNISPHEQNALAPAVMSNGDILYSCWNAHENKSFDTKTAHSNKPATAKNKWWLCRTDGNGADATVILNGHKTMTLKTKAWLPGSVSGGENRTALRAIRSVAEIHKDRLAVTNYYRSNHVGSMGIIFALDYLDPHVEGCSTASCYPEAERRSGRRGSGHFVPSTLTALTPYGMDQDMAVRRDAKGRALGKAGYPAPLPNTDSQYLITHARGSCYEVTRFSEANRHAMGGEPTCQKALYKVKVDRVTNPFDQRQMELLAGGEQWQVWDGRAIAPYRDFFGQELPDQPEPLDENAACYLQVVDARKAELEPANPYDWLNTLYQQCAFQGCAVNTEDPNFHARNMHALTVFLPQMWDFTYSGNKQKAYASILNNTGHKSMATLGSQPLLADGSVKMRVPCETPLIMVGTDRNGMMIAHDVMLHSLRAGESRTCHGCHDGHSEERAAQIRGSAVERFAATAAFNTFPPMPASTPPVTFADVQPILERRCSGCHKDMTNHDGLLYSRVAQDYEQHDWPWARKQPGVGNRTHVEHVMIKRPGRGYAVGDKLQFPPGGAAGQVAAVNRDGGIAKIRLTAGGAGYEPFTRLGVASAGGQGADLVAMTDRFDLPRPYSSKWVARFARDSLLYWKCVGSRQDGRTDKQYANDIDFGPAHESGATAQECQTIGRWIDTGIQHNLQ